MDKMKSRFGWSLLLVLAACSEGGIGTRHGALDMAAATDPRVDAGPRTQRPAPAPAGSVADAPDRGALVTYQKGGPVRTEGALALHPAAISEAHAINAIATGEMVLPTPGGREVRLRYLRHVEQLDGNWTWVGQVVGGDPRQNAVITFGERAVFGSIPQGSEPPLQLLTRHGKLFVVQTDPSRAANRRQHDDGRVPPSSNRLWSPVPASAKALGGNTLQAASSGERTVDVVAGYSTHLADELGGASAATTRLVYLVAYGSQTMANSEVDGDFRLVGTVQVDYAENTSNNDALDALTEATAPELDPVHEAREAYGADVALLVRDLAEEHEGCGIAWSLGSNQREIVPSDADWAYAVVSDGEYTVGQTTWFCSDSTLSHEVGHLLGSVHDRANASRSGRYPYSYGYNANGVCDVMAYCAAGNTEYQVYSNPRIDICGGSACGVVDSEDNARSLDQTLPLIAAFRATVVPHGPVRTQRNDFDGDGRSDVFWRNLADGRNIVWWGAEYANQGNPGSVANQAWSVVGAGDFDGDGESDLFWRNSANGQNIVWPSGEGSLKRSVTTITGLAWKVVTVGDFNGDGRADLFWRHDTNGQNAVWWSGDYAARTTEQAVSSAWKVVGAGDLDGDGADDVFWRNTATGANIVWWSGDYAGYGSLTGVTNQAWEVVAIGDYAGDGIADVFWRNRATGENIIWWNGNYANQVREATVSTAWKVVASGDYDGDGKADLFWRNGTTGANILWDAGRYAQRRNLTGVTSSAWVVQQ